MKPVRIQGAISFEGPVFDVSGAAVYVRLIDTSRSDAPARTITEYKVPSLPLGADASEEIPFELDANVTDARGSYTISAHIDLDGDGEISIGDYITKQSFPVGIDSPSTFYVVTVSRIEE